MSESTRREGMDLNENVADLDLRPSGFEEFTGQRNIVANLKVFIEAAKMRGEALDHVLLTGPPGLGKTTLSHIIAREMGKPIKITSGPAIEKPGDLAGILTNLEEGEVLFIDEIHRLSKVIEEYLYSAMEDYRIDITIDSGPAARTIQLSLNKFTLVGATTRAGLLTSPLRSRFGVSNRLDYYNHDDLSKVILRSSGIYKTEIVEEASFELARRSRGTPRIANNLLRRSRDFAQVKGNGVITLDIVKHTLDALGVDSFGLDEMDKRLLSAIINKYDGGPVGLKTLSSSIGEEAGTIEEVYEPFLLQQGFLQITSQGRLATDLAYSYFGKTRNKAVDINTSSLFE